MNDLVGKSFLARCAIPGVREDTRIVAFCGAHDSEDGDGAAPLNDGRFVSEFYLFHHFFKDTAKNQVWLSSSNPDDLVRKYGPYHHQDLGPSIIAGLDRPANRKVVLSEEMLLDVQDIKVVESKDMKARFLAETQKVCEEIHESESGANVLVLMFARGQEETGHVYASFDPLAPDHPSQLLSPTELRDVILVDGNRDVNVTVLSTTCLAGNWAITPNLNTTSLLASNFWVRSESWSENQTIGSVSGGQLANAVVHALARLQIEDYHEYNGTGAKRAEFEVAVAGAVKLVFDILTKKVQSLVYDNEMIFSARDDRWEQAYSPRIRVPMALYGQRWGELEDAPLRTLPGTDNVVNSGTWGSSNRIVNQDELAKVVRKDAALFLASYPGRSTLPSNRVNRKLRAFVEGGETGETGEDELKGFKKALNFRFYIMDAANRWRKALGLRFPPCAEFDWQEWQHEHPEKAKLIHDLGTALASWPIFDHATRDEQPGWNKGHQYLVSAMAAADWTVEKMNDSLRPFFKGRIEGVPGSGVPVIEGVSRIMDLIGQHSLDRNNSIRAEFKRIAGSLKRGFRDLSPIELRETSPRRRALRGTITDE